MGHGQGLEWGVAREVRLADLGYGHGQKPGWGRGQGLEWGVVMDWNGAWSGK